MYCSIVLFVLIVCIDCMYMISFLIRCIQIESKKNSVINSEVSVSDKSK